MFLINNIYWKLAFVPSNFPLLQRLNGEYSIEGPEVIIDGSDNNVIYTPLCRECYLKEVLKIDFDKIKKDLYQEV